ncbi:putative chitinase 1 isoform X1 [Anopheles merus]|uniref:putative chitinase 1 isoform X1 n=1 Tax=Anopheles merus TaxID=30066 RepID=UPI001BE432AC|nr:putative chitinase 1 isoform X1 [Anopheles merus]XP_041777284.1 putative chitinase 1 isoform X1 [Anopheles merus]
MHIITPATVAKWMSNISHLSQSALSFASIRNTWKKIFVWIALTLTLCVELSTAQGKKIVCSYSPAKAGPIGYPPEYIPLEVCPYVIFKAFSFPSTVGRQMLFSDNDKIAFSRVVSSVRKRSSTVRVVASIDGYARDFTITSSAIVRRKAFVQAAVTLLLELDADGIELNWKAPGNSNAGYGSSNDRITMVQLLQDLRQAVKAASKSRNRNRELWFRGSLHPNVIDEAYNMLDVCELVDHITLDPSTVDSLENSHAPLYGTPITVPRNPLFNTDFLPSVIERMTGITTNTQRWIDEGCAPTKLLLGIGLHGIKRDYSPNVFPFISDKVNLLGQKGTYLEQRELCNTIREAGWSYTWDGYGGMPYVTRTFQNVRGERISYENLDSLRLKMDMVEQKRLGGIYIDYVHSDDIYGRCGQAYSLIAYLSSRTRSIPSDIGFAIEWI